MSGWIWSDDTGENHGVQDPGEPGFATSLPVSLLDSTGNTIATTWTVAGSYAFNGIANGQYRLWVDLPIGYTTRLPNQAADDIDSDWPEFAEYTDFFTINGATSLDLDCGVYEYGPR